MTHGVIRPVLAACGQPTIDTPEKAIWIILGDGGTPDDYKMARLMGLAPVPFFLVKEARAYLHRHFAHVLPPVCNGKQAANAVARHLASQGYLQRRQGPGQAA